MVRASFLPGGSATKTRTLFFLLYVPAMEPVIFGQCVRRALEQVLSDSQKRDDSLDQLVQRVNQSAQDGQAPELEFVGVTLRHLLQPTNNSIYR